MQTYKFTMRESNRQHVLKWLLEFDKSFFLSPEYYELKEYERDIIGVVCAAFARYLLRIQQEFLKEKNISDLRNPFLFIEKLAESRDSEIISILTDEIFENLDCDMHCKTALLENMGPISKTIWEKWNSCH